MSRHYYSMPWFHCRDLSPHTAALLSTHDGVTLMSCRHVSHSSHASPCRDSTSCRGVNVAPRLRFSTFLRVHTSRRLAFQRCKLGVPQSPGDAENLACTNNFRCDRKPRDQPPPSTTGPTPPKVYTLGRPYEPPAASDPLHRRLLLGRSVS
ncbi:hypothetical protein NDU88_010940 [Pleurodeles waltl]|uniref:Uncharacterized protein n=1 Tax=Pleurodeles waltl TaxID=8319 RepID=A0AAV7Q1M7_PLEWA|nr:hypothetical protein NDU88_010940 [Pleurodeles waltl]